MNIARADEFLDLYKQLEQALKVRSEAANGKYPATVAALTYSHEMEDCAEKLNAVREIRNLLQHNPKIDGAYPVEPSAETIGFLRGILETVAQPKLAIDFAVPEKQIYKTDLNANLHKVMRVMKERGFSHVPVMNGAKVSGVLSVSILFNRFAEDCGAFSAEAKVSLLADTLPVDQHSNEYYKFMKGDVSFDEVEEAFMKRYQGSKRLVAVFLTANGNAGGNLLGMLTPWSVVGK